ncbi:MAG TPA: 2-C-methyl-D-erythritol 4-phosphate cytidylyltransferase [Nocardioides sp.]|uniref:IspD/TarI family cytidylyltransferase n=1 Tax=Nocardioides sp. TaxID=35761 RepID=UPI002ED8889A
MPDTARSALVVLAAGAGTRVGAAVNKVLLPVADATVLGLSLRTALAVEDVRRIVLVVRPGEEEAVAAAVRPVLGTGEVLVVPGGATRHASEWSALQALRPDVEAGEIDVVAIHDGARPLASPELFAVVIDVARDLGGAIPVVPLTGAVDASFTPVTDVAGVQTPQAFRARPLLAAYEQAAADGFDGTDTAACLAAYPGDTGLRIGAVPSSPLNLKVTFAEDVATVDALLTRRG